METFSNHINSCLQKVWYRNIYFYFQSFSDVYMPLQSEGGKLLFRFSFSLSWLGRNRKWIEEYIFILTKIIFCRKCRNSWEYNSILWYFYTIWDICFQFRKSLSENDLCSPNICNFILKNTFLKEKIILLVQSFEKKRGGIQGRWQLYYILLYIYTSFKNAQLLRQSTGSWDGRSSGWNICSLLTFISLFS